MSQWDHPWEQQRQRRLAEQRRPLFQREGESLGAALIYGIVIAALLFGGIVMMERSGISIEIKQAATTDEPTSIPQTRTATPQIDTRPQDIQPTPVQAYEVPQQSPWQMPQQKPRYQNPHDGVAEMARAYDERMAAERQQQQQSNALSEKDQWLATMDHSCDSLGPGLIRYRECRANCKKVLQQVCTGEAISLRPGPSCTAVWLAAQNKEIRCYVADNYQIVQN